MKWMIVCLYLSGCENGYQVQNWGTYTTKEGCEAALAKDNSWLDTRHKEGGEVATFSFHCVEINP